MFVRVKGTEPYRYLQIVENYRVGKHTRQRVLCTLGRVERLIANGSTDALLRSLSRFGQQVQLVEEYKSGQLEARAVRQIPSVGCYNRGSCVLLLPSAGAVR